MGHLFEAVVDVAMQHFDRRQFGFDLLVLSERPVGSRFAHLFENEIDHKALLHGERLSLASLFGKAEQQLAGLLTFALFRTDPRHLHVVSSVSNLK